MPPRAELAGRVAVLLDGEDETSERQNALLKGVLQSAAMRYGIVGQSPALLKSLNELERVSQSQATVMLLGESGTGKELVARAIHNRSPRKNGPFVPVHTGAIPRELIGSELFGHERGAFTGANKATVGKIETANGGTLHVAVSSTREEMAVDVRDLPRLDRAAAEHYAVFVRAADGGPLVVRADEPGRSRVVQAAEGVSAAVDGDVPADLFRKPYPHDNVNAAAKEASAVPKPTAEEIERARKILAGDTEATASGVPAEGVAAPAAQAAENAAPPARPGRGWRRCRPGHRGKRPS